MATSGWLLLSHSFARALLAAVAALAVTGLLNPTISAGAMAVSSLLVVSNSLRLRKTPS